MKKTRKRKKRVRFELARVLKKRKMSLLELGRRTGLAKSTLTELRQGRAAPTLDTMAIIAEELDTTVDELIPSLRKKRRVPFATVR